MLHWTCNSTIALLRRSIIGEKKHHCGTTAPMDNHHLGQNAGHVEEGGENYREIERHGAMLGKSDVRMSSKAHPSWKRNM